jgi:hypothetical protein
LSLYIELSFILYLIKNRYNNRTFNLPSLSQGQTPIGMSGEYIGKSTQGTLPNISLQFDAESTVGYNTLGGMMQSKTQLDYYGLDGGNRGMSVFRYSGSANHQNSIYGSGWYNGTKVIPAGSGVSYIIKY